MAAEGHALEDFICLSLVGTKEPGFFGCGFYFLFLLSIPSEANVSFSDARESDLVNQPANILVISPDVKLSKGISEALSDISPQIRNVPNSRDGVKKVRDEKFDIVISDSRLQDFSCPVLIRRVIAGRLTRTSTDFILYFPFL